MKKLIAGVFAATLTTAGLVAVTGTAATAAPYTGTVKTVSSVTTPAPVKAGKPAIVKVKVGAGNAKAKGKVTVVVKNKAGKIVSKKVVDYKGKTIKVKTSKLKKAGAYKVVVRFAPKRNSVFKASKSKTKISVRK
ncbi:hypothetical protein [Nocardioides pantholopis]|uniref:hypothetical protein n=1 Tax=Nocardioides pantholopis TaxID=2483798 RepID=UPI000F0836CA|nr:hypothetical protein [Nocardioides pantholopis]